MKKILFLLHILFATLVSAQQEQQFTQFMYNKLSYNPAYAGSNMSACFTALHRSQWSGFDGAPSAQLISYNTALMNGKVGVGGNLVHQSIGVDNRFTMDGAYAYRVPVAKGNLGIGLQASIRYRGINFNDSRLLSTVPLNQDGAIEAGYQSKFVPNFGVGAYYNTEKFYIGAALPRLIKNNIGFSESTGALTKETNHIYVMGGFIMPISSNLKLQPQALLKYAANTPFDAEVNLNAVYQDRYTLGLTYRAGGSSKKGFGESLDFLLALQLNQKIMLGLSYDYSLSELRSYSNGSMEVMLRYCYRKEEGTNFVNPRFF